MPRAPVLLAATAVAVPLLAGPASASLCIYPGNASAASEAVHGDTLIAQPPVTPEEFLTRGASMDNPAGKLAAWEAHFASQELGSGVVDGPACS